MRIPGIKTTKQHKKFWQERVIDWKKQYLDTWNHPHRQLISWALQTFNWVSLWEVGCGPGANIMKLVHDLKGKQMGGSDINAEAIELARSTFIGARFHVESTEDLLLSDNSVDVILSDASLIYIGPTKIHKTLQELARVARGHIVLCEFHSTSLLKRLWFRFKTGYNAYDYQKELEAVGCYDIQLIKITKEFWEGFPWETHGYIIIAKVSKI